MKKSLYSIHDTLVCQTPNLPTQYNVHILLYGSAQPNCQGHLQLLSNNSTQNHDITVDRRLQQMYVSYHLFQDEQAQNLYGQYLSAD